MGVSPDACIHTNKNTFSALSYHGFQSHTSVYVTCLHTRYVPKDTHAHHLYGSNTLSSLQKWGWDGLGVQFIWLKGFAQCSLAHLGV